MSCSSEVHAINTTREPTFISRGWTSSARSRGSTLAVPTNRGDATAATRIFRGGERRGYSGEASRGDAAAAMRTFGRDRRFASRYGRRHAFVLRYEDLCNQPRRVPAALEAWLPGLGAGVDVERRPGAGRRLTKKHSHSQKSIPEYCRADFIPRLPYFRRASLPKTRSRRRRGRDDADIPCGHVARLRYRASLPTEKRKMSASLLDFFDYGAGFESAETTGRVTGS